MDVEKQIEYWRSGSEEDIEVAGELLEKNRIRHALFFGELSVEKMLKAHVAKGTRKVPPPIHDLLRLADLARLQLSPDQREFLARFQRYCFAGRYPDRELPALPRAVAENVIKEAREFLKCLIHQLK